MGDEELDPLAEDLRTVGRGLFEQEMVTRVSGRWSTMTTKSSRSETLAQLLRRR
ncbi:MAG: hypothetical protein ACI8XM_000176 [Haloarculaceae archaeon]|jgi:hypothetical protein